MVREFEEIKKHTVLERREYNDYKFIIAKTRNQRTEDARVYAIHNSELEKVKEGKFIESAYLLTSKVWQDLAHVEYALLRYGGVLVRKVSSKMVLEDLTRHLT